MASKQTDASQFRRDCENRTFAERQLDKFILNAERKQQEKEKDQFEDKIMKKMKTGSASIFNQNTAKSELFPSSSQQKDQQEQQELQKQDQEQLQVQQQQKQSVSIYEGIIKVCKHLSNQSKAVKALGMLEKLIQKHVDSLKDEQKIDILVDLLQNRSHFNSVKNQVKQIYLLLSENAEFQQKYEALIKTAQIYFVDFIDLYTDDSFQFNQVTKRLMQTMGQIAHEQIEIKQFNSLTEEQKEELHKMEVKKLKEQLKEQEKKKQVLSIKEKLQKNNENNKSQNEVKNKLDYEYTQSDFCQDLLKNKSTLFELKMKLVFDIFECVLPFYVKYDWAKPSINLIYQEVYQNLKFCFPQELHQKMDDLAEQWMDQKNSDSKSTVKRSNLDGKIGSIGVSKSEVKDARSVSVFLDNGLSSWGNKQNGL